MGIHWQELIIILLIVLVLFGPKRLPEIGSQLGNGIRGFRDSLNGSGTTPSDQHVVAATVAAEDATQSHPAAVPAPVEVVVQPTAAAPHVDPRA